MSYQIMNLNSKFRTADSLSSSDFTISIGQSLSIKQMVIKNIIVPNSTYNITQYNNVGFLEQGVGTYVILIPIGQYNLADFIIALQAQLTTIDIASTVVQNPVTLKLDFTFSLPSRFTCDSNSPLSQVIGVKNSGQPFYPAVAVTSFPASGLTNLSGVRAIYICSRILAQGVNSVLHNGTNLPLVLMLPQ